MPQERWTNFLVNKWPPKLTSLWRLLVAKAGKETFRLMRRCVRARLAGRHPEIQVRYIKHLNVTHNLEALDSCNVYTCIWLYMPFNWKSRRCDDVDFVSARPRKLIFTFFWQNMNKITNYGWNMMRPWYVWCHILPSLATSKKYSKSEDNRDKWPFATQRMGVYIECYKYRHHNAIAKCRHVPT